MIHHLLIKPQYKKTGAKIITIPEQKNYQLFKLSQNQSKNYNTKKNDIQKLNCVALQSSSSQISGSLSQLLKLFAHPYHL